jgi:type I restriction enzyme, S subunit
VKVGWELLPVSEFAKTSAGGTPKKSNTEFYAGGNIPWLLSGEVANPNITKAKNHITQKGLSGSSAKIFPPNSVLVAMYGATAGEAGILKFEAATNQAVCAVLPNERYVPEFLYYYLLHAKPSLVAQAVGNAQPNISQAKIKSLAIPLPPLDEQKRIVAVLDAAFEGLTRARANAEANLQNAREVFAVTIEDSLQKAGGVPVTLAELLERNWITSHLDGNHGSSYPRKDEFVSEGVPYISANCIDGDVIDLSKSKFLTPKRADTLRKGVARNRDVIFAHNATVGPVALLTTDEQRIILSTSLTYYRCDESKISPEFLMFAMRSAGFKRQYEAVMEQATRNQVPITMQRKFSHIIPSMDEQLKIAEIGVQIEIDARDLEIHYKKKFQDLDDLRQSLLQKAFAGELT